MIEFQSGAQQIKSVASYGGPLQYTEQGSFVVGSAQLYGYLTYRNDQKNGVSSLTLENGTEIVQNLTPTAGYIIAPNGIGGLSSGNQAKVVVRQNGRLKYFEYLNMSSSSQTAVTMSAAIGSLARHVEDTTLAQLSGRAAGDQAQNAWATYAVGSGGVTAATPNSNSIVAGLNISATSIWRSGQSNDQFPLMLVSPRHAITAGHVNPSIGTVVTYRRPDGTIQNVTVDKVSRPPNSDLGIVHFNADVTGISPYPLCPLVTLDKLHRSPTLPERVLCFVKALHRPDGTWKSYWGLSFALYVSTPSATGWSLKISVGASALVHDNAAQVQAFGCSTGIGGDSGSPAFWFINGQLCIVGVWSTAGGYMQSLVGYETQINQTMNELATSVADPAAGTYAVNTVAVSGFTSYP